MKLGFYIKWNIINPIFKQYCQKLGCKNKPMYKVAFTMPSGLRERYKERELLSSLKFYFTNSGNFFEIFKQYQATSLGR